MSFDTYKVYLRCSGVTVLGKAIWHGVHQFACRCIVGINIYLTELTERTKIVNTTGMVIVYVCKQHGINLTKRLREHLLSKVWPRVYEYSRVIGLHQCRATQPLIVLVCTFTNATVAAYRWYSHRCSGAEKNNFHNLSLPFHTTCCKFHNNLFQVFCGSGNIFTSG